MSAVVAACVNATVLEPKASVCILEGAEARAKGVNWESCIHCVQDWPSYPSRPFVCQAMTSLRQRQVQVLLEVETSSFTERDWRMSLERLDNDVGYERHNCALIAAEFNTSEKMSQKVALEKTSGSSKWSMVKVQGLPMERSLNVDLKKLDEAIQGARLRKQHLAFKGMISEPSCGWEKGHGHLKCSCCGLWQPTWNYSLHTATTRGFQPHCKSCTSAYELARRMRLRGHIMSLLASARGRHKFGRWDGEFELNFDDVLEMLWSQKGRCLYSDVPLRFAELNTDWMMSLKRLDNRKTHEGELSAGCPGS